MIDTYLKGRCPVAFRIYSPMRIFQEYTFAFVVVISIGFQVCLFGHFPKGNMGVVICVID